MNLKDIITKVRDSISDKSQWQTERDGVLAQLIQAEDALKDFRESAVTASQLKDTYEKQIADLTLTHTSAVQVLNDTIKDLAAKVETEKVSVEAKAQTIAASIGIASETQLPKVITNVEDNDSTTKKKAVGFKVISHVIPKSVVKATDSK